LTQSVNHMEKKELSMETRLLIAFGLMGVVLLVNPYLFKQPTPPPNANKDGKDKAAVTFYPQPFGAHMLAIALRRTVRARRRARKPCHRKHNFKLTERGRWFPTGPELTTGIVLTEWRSLDPTVRFDR